MRYFLLAIILACLLSLSCSGILIHHALDQGQTLSKEQIQAYREMNMDVYGCFAVAGPPPSGGTIWIIVPKGSAVTFSISDGCRLLPFASRP